MRPASAFTLEVGISSSLEIALGWGIADLREPPHTEPATPGGRPVDPPPARPESAGVARIIDDALRAAGLVK